MYRIKMYSINWQGLSFWVGLSILAGLSFGLKAGLAVFGGSLLLTWAASLFD